MRIAPAIALLTVLGLALRLVFAHQSLNGDELSTLWMVSGRSLAGVVSTVHTDREITPPLYFVLAWLATRIADTPELLRAPALIAGTASIPLVFLVGRRTVGTRAAMLAAALTALSPFMIYYSAEARAYGLLMALVLLSTLAMLLAIERRSRAWWVVYAVASCATAYTHYTGVFALAGQLAWLLWAHPEARRAALIANVAAAAAFLPWLSGLRDDLGSTTTDLLSALQPFTARSVRVDLTHWAFGYPPVSERSGLRAFPGVAAIALLTLATAAAAVAAGARWARGRPRVDPGVVLAIVLAVSVPAGEIVASIVGSNLLSARNLAASWPGFALCLASLLASSGRRLAVATSVAAVAAFGIAAVRLLSDRFARPDYRAVAGYIDRTAAPGDVVVDGASLNPAGTPPALRAALSRRHPFLSIGAVDVRYNPFRIIAAPPPPSAVIARAVSVAHGRRIYLVLVDSSPNAAAIAAVPPSYRLTTTRVYPGLTDLTLRVYTATGA